MSRLTVFLMVATFTIMDQPSNTGCMVNQGADILDIGGESTRPNALVIDAEEEWRAWAL